MVGRVILFQCSSDHSSFLSFAYHEKGKFKKVIRDFIYSKEFNSKRFKDNLIKKIKKSGVDSYKILLSAKDILHFQQIVNFMDNNRSRSEAEKFNSYRKVNIEHNNITYGAKIKMHLGEPRHWRDAKKSYSVKLTGNKLINNLKKIDFIVPEDRGYFPPLLCKELSRLSDLPHPENGYCLLYINDECNGVYLMEEEFDNNPDFFEKNRVPNDFSIRPKFKDITELVLWDSNLEFWESSAIDVDSPYSEEINNKIEKYLAGLRTMDFEKLKGLVDVEKIAAVTAINIFWGYSHDYIERNIRLVYSVDSGLIYYQPRAEDGAKTLELKSPHNPNAEKIQSFEHGMNYFYKTKFLRMFQPFLQNKKFRDKRNSYLKGFFNSMHIEKRISELSNKSLEIFPLDPFAKYNNQIISHLIKDQESKLLANAKVIKMTLSTSSLFLKFLKSRQKLTISILPDSLAKLKINDFKIQIAPGVYTVTKRNTNEIKLIKNDLGFLNLSQIFDEEYLMANLDFRLLPQKNYLEITITGGSFKNFHEESISISATNTFTDLRVPENRTHISVIDDSTNFSELKTQSSTQFINSNNFLNLNRNNNNLFLEKATYEIYNDLIIPKGLVLNVEAGTVFNMYKNKSIISYSPINFNGTLKEPITIQSKNEKQPFGTVGMIFKSPMDVKLTHLSIIGGSEKFADGVFFNGALSIHNGNIKMNSCIVQKCKADDGINFKNSKAEIRNCTFINNQSDHIDLDFCTSLIESNEFDNIDTQNTGDAIDLSGSSVVIKNNFLRRSGDKAISVGEKSNVLILDNKINSNLIGIAVKDSSEALVSENFFSTNRTNIRCYVKKGIFKGGNAYLFNNTNLNHSSIQLDEKSDFFRLSAFDGQSVGVDVNNIQQIVDSVFKSVKLNFEKN